MSSDTRTPQAPRDTRSTIIRVATFLGGIYFFLYFLSPESLLETTGVKVAHESISNGFIAIGAMAIGLGIINIVMSHGSRVIFLKKDWIFSAALLTGLCAMIGVTAGQWWSSRATTNEIRRVQIVGEFASRIVEDAKAGKGHERSFFPGGALPALSERVGALERYSATVLEQITREREEMLRSNPSDEGLKTLLSELEQSATELAAAREGLSTTAWDVLIPQAESSLERVSMAGAKLASMYAIVKRKVVAQSLVNRLYEFLYNGLFNQLGSAMFALLGVYIAAAAYRAFRIRSVESALMMAAALVVMLGQISFGKMVYQDMPALRQWLLEVPNSAAFRAIRLGAGVAGLLLAIRMWLSIESSARIKGGRK